MVSDSVGQWVVDLRQWAMLFNDILWTSDPVGRHSLMGQMGYGTVSVDP